VVLTCISALAGFLLGMVTSVQDRVQEN